MLRDMLIDVMGNRNVKEGRRYGSSCYITVSLHCRHRERIIVIYCLFARMQNQLS